MRPRLFVAPDWDGNGKKVTAAVTRYGCQRGEIFGGCEPRRGNHRLWPARHPRMVAGAPVDCETRWTPGRLWDAISPRPCVWSKPSWWWETTKAERDSADGSVGPKRASVLGSGCAQVVSAEGW